MKKIFKIPFIAVLLIITLLFSSAGLPLLAEENKTEPVNSPSGQVSSKEEVIYCSLDNSGKLKNIYVVNILNVTIPGVVYDYGSYSSLKNLTDTGELVSENGKVKINAPEGRFYYQGNLENGNLPWSVDISYYIDGVKKDPKNLAGADGHVKIEINTKKNNGIDSGFFENYLLQVSVQLNTERFSNIDAAGATMANAGANKIVNFTVLPGVEGNLSIEADVTDFEMGSIEFSAIPFSMQIEMPDMSEFSDEFSALANAIAQLNTGVEALAKGLAEISGGAAAITYGSSEFKNGLAALDSKSDEIIQASSMIMDTLNNLSAMMSIPEAQAANPQLAYALTELTKNYNGFHMGLEGYTQGVSQLASSYPGIHAGIEGLAGGVNKVSEGAKELSSGTDTLYENTKDLPQKIDAYSKDLLSDYDKSDYEPVSFISSENRDVTSVQFVMRTEKIEKEEARPAQTTEKEPETFWTRLLDLFR
jgi:putative membrane protein